MNENNKGSIIQLKDSTTVCICEIERGRSLVVQILIVGIWVVEIDALQRVCEEGLLRKYRSSIGILSR